MNSIEQLALNLDARNSWAFANRRGSDRYRIFSVSKTARALGVKKGMDYYQAKQILPELKIMRIKR